MLRGCVVWAGCPYLLPFYSFTFLPFHLFTLSSFYFFIFLLFYFLLLIHSALRPVATVEVAVADGFADVLHLHTL